MKLFISGIHTELIGKLAKLTEQGVILEQEYEYLFGMGNYEKAIHNHYYHYCGGRYELKLMFIDEPPFSIAGQTWYCLKEVGTGCHGDYFWYTLDQLMICD